MAAQSTHPPAPGAAYDPGADWTAAPAAPPPDPNLRLLPRGTGVSFDVNDPELLSRWLQSAGWRALPGRSPSEYARMMRGRQLIVLYARSALIQGCCTAETLALLEPLYEVQP